MVHLKQLIHTVAPLNQLIHVVVVQVVQKVVNIKVVTIHITTVVHLELVGIVVVKQVVQTVEQAVLMVVKNKLNTMATL